MGGHDLREDKFYFIEGHVYRRTYFTGSMSYWRISLQENMSYGKTCLIGGYVYRTCFTERYVVLENMSYKRTCLNGSPVLLRTYLTE